MLRWFVPNLSRHSQASLSLSSISSSEEKSIAIVEVASF